MSNYSESEKNKQRFKNKIVDYIMEKGGVVSGYMILISVNFYSHAYMHKCLSELIREKKIEKVKTGYKLKG